MNFKQALLALSDAEKAATELTTLKARQSEAAAAREESIRALDQAMAKVKLEKKLKAKEARVQAKLAELSTPGGAAK